MRIDSPLALFDALHQHSLLDSAHLEELSRTARFGAPRAIARELVKRGLLTDYQVQQLFDAATPELNFGPYRALALIGKGGVSRVFKAWHTRKNCVVALKVIHRELMTRPDVVAQFQQEMWAIAQLAHPNIVQAFETTRAATGAYYFALEYVEGTDLAQLLQTSGPLDLGRACDYARQTALGLQHIYEHGLVHRDIKPANLLLLQDSHQIKITDMGLARLEFIRAEAQAMVNTLHSKGSVMGSPDYLAPEQAIDPDKADIRADLYGLGCTLYHMLTGQVPFPGGSLAQKLLRHQVAEPVLVESLRPEAPVPLGQVVRKLMSKRPADRYLTPASAAAALTPFVRRFLAAETARPTG